MDPYKQTSVWVYRIVVVFGSIIAGSLIEIITRIMKGQPIPGIIAVFGLVSVAGLIRLLISPLNQRLFN